MADAEISRDDAYERDLFASIAATPLAMIITNPRLADNPIVAANRAFSALTGYPAAEAVGRNCRFLAGSATDRACSSILRDAIAAGRPALTELINYRKDGTPFRNAVMIAPVFGPDGAAAYFIGSQVEVPGEAALGGGVRRERALGLIAKLTPRQGQVLKEMGDFERERRLYEEAREAIIKTQGETHRRARDLTIRLSAEAVSNAPKEMTIA